MSNIKWEELTPEDRVSLIAEKVMGWECYKDWTQYAAKYHTQDYVPSTTKLVFYPVLNKWRIVVPNPNVFCVFDPLNDMNAAWQVLEQMKEHDTLWSMFCERIQGIVDTQGSVYRLADFPALLKALDAQMICQASLQAMDMYEGEDVAQ
jgi:hypothetical protein